jgi:hypothetical protein
VGVNSNLYQTVRGAACVENWYEKDLGKKQFEGGGIRIAFFPLLLYTFISF